MKDPRLRRSRRPGGCALGSLVALAVLSWTVAVAAAAGAAAAATPLLAHGWSSGAAAPSSILEAVIATVALVLGGAFAARYGLAATLGAMLAVAARRGRRLPHTEAAIRAWAPPAVRRALTLTVGGAVGLGLAVAPASASSQIPDDLRWSPVTVGAPALAPVAHQPPAPSPSGTSPVPAAPQDPQDPASDSRPGHVVRAGDSLWAVAADSLAAGGRAVTAAAVAAEWPRWYAANTELIGPDPGLIRPGQLLTPPEEGPAS